MNLPLLLNFGHFHPLHFPFGTKLNSLVWVELMDKLLAHFDKSKLAYFIDRVVLAANSVEEKIQMLDEILDIFKQDNLIIDPKKMQIYKREIEFLGFIIHENSYSLSL